MRIIFMGYHNIGYACLEALIELCRELGDEIVAVVTHADDPQENIWFASVRELAFENYLPVYQPADPNDPAFVAAMQRFATGFSVFVLLSPHAEAARSWTSPAWGP